MHQTVTFVYLYTPATVGAMLLDTLAFAKHPIIKRHCFSLVLVGFKPKRADKENYRCRYGSAKTTSSECNNARFIWC